MWSSPLTYPSITSRESIGNLHYWYSVQGYKGDGLMLRVADEACVDDSIIAEVAPVLQAFLGIILFYYSLGRFIPRHNILQGSLNDTSPEDHG